MGARTGPSIMPGGDKEAYEFVRPILEAVAAKVNNVPCVAYLGNHAAGHYVKMVHNGIEYALMQLISEVYDVLKKGLGLNNKELHDVFKNWNQGQMKSFLLEITADIFTVKDEFTDQYLVDVILDKAGAKGTGKWTSQDAMDLTMPIPTIDIAVSMRDLSVYKDDRIKAAALYKTPTKKVADKENFIQQLHDALYFATIISYAQGLAMLHKASSDLDMQIPLPEVIKIWRGGCIIRSGLFEVFYSVYKNNPGLSNLLLSKEVSELLKEKEPGIREIIKQVVEMKIPFAGFMSAFSYFNAYGSEQLPTNLIQAQRDYFGAHTYQRIDKEGVFHTEWQPLPEHKP